MATLNDTMQEFSFQSDEFYLDLQEDGSRISLLKKEEIIERPFPGLRPFKTSEFQLFKGRGGQAEELIKRLKKTHFLAVIGSSGTGKSSLVRAGLIPQLFGGYLHEAGNKWNIAICRPGKNPVENLAIALSSIKGHSKDKQNIYNNYHDIEPLLSNSVYGILDVNELLNADKRDGEKPNLLIIIDQFEELFRFNRKDLCKQDIENHFVNLLLKASVNTSSSVYVIITMRSEFLGDCVKYRGLAEAINEGQYLVPQLIRNQLKEVIEGPINLAGKKIAPGLVELLINEIDENKLKENLDQLPILQHALMRTYQEAVKQGAEAEINCADYEKTGEMEMALANHAEAKFKELADGVHDDNRLSKKQKVAKIIFQALTDLSADQKGGRRPTELENIYAIAECLPANKNEIDEVINHFRDSETSFIMPPLNTALYPKLIMDISHESLMRNWERLNNWIIEEVHYGKLYKTLNEWRELNERDNEQWLGGILLKELIDWRDHALKNAVWASRYLQVPKDINSAAFYESLYKKNLQFLKYSELKNEERKTKEKNRIEEEVKRVQREKTRKKVIWIFAAAAFISFCFGLWAFSERAKATKNYLAALSQEKEVQKQKELALNSEKEARKQAELASAKSELALKYADSARKQKAIAEDKTREAQQQKELALKYANEVTVQNEEAKKQLVKNEIQKEKFYQSNSLDLTAKDSILASLFKKPLGNPQKIERSGYIYTDLLIDINKAAEAKEQIIEDPAAGLRNAEDLWKNNKNRSIEKILFDIFRKNIFYSKNLAPVSDQSFYIPSLLTISKDASRFAFNNLNSIVTGIYSRGSLAFDNKNYANVFKSRSNFINNYDGQEDIIALSYAGRNKILSFQNNGKITEWSNSGEKIRTDILPGKEKFITSRFSPDGTMLITVSVNGILKIWNIPALRSGKQSPSFIDNDNSNIGDNKNIREIVFSPDSKRIIKIINNYGFEVYNLLENLSLKSSSNYKTSFNGIARFSTDGKYILGVSAGNKNKIMIMIIDISAPNTPKDTLSLPAFANDKSYTSDPISYTSAAVNDLNLSADYKELIIKQGEDIFLYDSPGADDSIFNVNSPIQIKRKNLRCRKFSGPQKSTVKALFLNDSTVISIKETGNLYLWNTDANFKNLDEALTSVRNSYADEIRSSNKGVIKGEYTNTTPNYNLINELTKQNTDIGEKLLRDHPENIEMGKRLSLDYWDRSWYLLLDNNTENYNLSIMCAKRGIELDSINIGIYTNLALGYLLKNQFKDAEKIYKEYKDSSYFNPYKKSFQDAFLQDLNYLENKTIISKEKTPEIYNEVLHIRKDILGKNS